MTIMVNGQRTFSLSEEFERCNVSAEKARHPEVLTREESGNLGAISTKEKRKSGRWLVNIFKTI
jgi:hypothetical protein